MGKVVILDEHTANRIAAGEVIERPASIVKELVENSLDAGAEAIAIEIKNGGISYISVTDNGKGIEPDDVEIAFERHATSKIRSADDLELINTFGFRGEALASIAAVSKLQLFTMAYGYDQGVKCVVEAGKVKEIKKDIMQKGTRFVIKELFFNTPARYKFLKKDTTEAGYVSNIVNRLALANPHVSFKFINNGAEVLHTPGNNDLLSVIYCIYGRDTANSVIPVKYNENGLSIDGFIGKPQISRATRNFQTFFVNSRYIKSNLISSAIEEALKTMLMKGKFAFAVLDIKINPVLVDVNVHPAKTEIRFSDEKSIFSSIYFAIKNAFEGKSLITELTQKQNKHEQIKDTQNTQISISDTSVNASLDKSLREPKKELSDKGIDSFKEKVYEKHDFKIDLKLSDVIDKATKIDAIDVKNEAISLDVIDAKDEANNLDAIDAKDEANNIDVIDVKDKANNLDVFDVKNEANKEQEILSDKENRSFLIEGRVVGQIFSTYIIVEYLDNIYYIDQHAAHERINYEALLKKYGNNENIAQPLLTPLVVNVTYQEQKLLLENKELLLKLGIEFDEFGNDCVLLRTVPYIISENFDTDTFKQLIDKINKLGDGNNNLLMEESIYLMSCKSAIKANREMNIVEIKGLLEKLYGMNNPYTCVHGRPVIINTTKKEFEKRFKRIV